jgi:signal transduction histidine kinase
MSTQNQHGPINNSPVILAVDDNPRNLQLITSLLSQKGYKVVVANSGENALKYLMLKKPDLILLDIMMPGMSGYEVCEEIVKRPDLKGIPVIFLTAKSELNDIVAGFRIGAVDYITKPFRSEEAIARIETQLELRRIRKELEQKNEIITQESERLRLAIAEKDRYFSILAHDLRAPLAGFQATTELLENNFHSLSPDEAIQFISTMADSARQLNKLLENLLSWAQLQLGIMKPNPENFNVNILVENAISSQKNLAARKNIVIENNIDKSVQILADYQMTLTIFRNLTSNAIKFSHRGGKISLSNKPPIDGFVSVEIADSGIGMSNETLQSLFRLHAKVSRPGTEGEASSGLGLILCKDLAERNNGTIGVSSVEGQGSTFVVRLPQAV